MSGATIDTMRAMLTGSHAVAIWICFCPLCKAQGPCTAPPDRPGNVAGSTVICANTTHNYSVDAVRGATAYQWILPAGWLGSSSTNSIAVKANATGGKISVDALNDCGISAERTLAIRVEPVPAAPGITVFETRLSSGSHSGNQWYLNGKMIAGATAPSYSSVSNGTYNVAVTLAGCTSPLSAPVIINSASTGSTTTPDFHFRAFPNPNDGTFQISFNTPLLSDYTIVVFKPDGQLIFRDELTDFVGEYSTRLSVAEHGKGVYSVSLQHSAEEILLKVAVH